MYLQRQAERPDDPLQSVVGLSGPVPKAGLVRWAVKQLCPRKEEQAVYLRRQAERRDAPLQSAVGLSGPVPKAGLVRWLVKQLCPRPPAIMTGGFTKGEFVNIDSISDPSFYGLTFGSGASGSRLLSLVFDGRPLASRDAI